MARPQSHGTTAHKVMWRRAERSQSAVVTAVSSGRLVPQAGACSDVCNRAQPIEQVGGAKSAQGNRWACWRPATVAMSFPVYVWALHFGSAPLLHSLLGSVDDGITELGAHAPLGLEGASELVWPVAAKRDAPPGLAAVEPYVTVMLFSVGPSYLLAPSTSLGRAGCSTRVVVSFSSIATLRPLCDIARLLHLIPIRNGPKAGAKEEYRWRRDLIKEQCIVPPAPS